MNETTNPRVCERADDLVSFLYGELSESEMRSFELHKQSCSTCESELAAFVPIHQSIVDWRDRSLRIAPAVAPAQIGALIPAPRRSALAAIRGFFDLSPLWMKGATAFAVLLFCVLAGLALVRLIDKPQRSEQPGQFYSSEEFKVAVQKEAAQQLAAQQLALSEKKTGQEVAVDEKGSNPRRRPAATKETVPQLTVSSETPRKVRKPLTRAEREQLAADLRLIQEDDEDSLELLGDRINR